MVLYFFTVMQDIFGIIYHDGGDLAEWHVAFYKLPLE